jgi:hypothetical protein
MRLNLDQEIKADWSKDKQSLLVVEEDEAAMIRIQVDEAEFILSLGL